MIPEIINILTLVCAGIVFFASFCRLTKTTVETKPEVRLGIVVLAGVSLLALVAPFVWQWDPDWIHFWLFFGIALHKTATRNAWAHHVPVSYLR